MSRLVLRATGVVNVSGNHNRRKTHSSTLKLSVTAHWAEPICHLSAPQQRWAGQALLQPLCPSKANTSLHKMLKHVSISHLVFFLSRVCALCC